MYHRILLSYKKWNYAICNTMAVMFSEISQKKTNTEWYHLHVDFEI